MRSLTLKKVPKRLHQQLKERAVLHRRSLSQEALACLEQIVAAPVDVAAVLGKARAQRAHVKSIRQRDLNAWLREGRL